MIVDPGIPVLGFALLGLAVGLSTRRRTARRGLVNTFIAYTLAVSFGAGFTQHELWPFSAWPLVAGRVPASVTHPRFLAVDALGREHEIDSRAWEPIVFQELVAWEEKNFMGLDAASRDRAAAYLLDLVERARTRWAAGTPDRHFDKYLGPLSAPFFLGHPRHWIAGVRVPDTRFVALRLYKETWNVEERQRDPSRVVRRLAYEYRAP
jgi:hypothetical protein